MKQLIKHIYSICIGTFLLISVSSFIPAETTTGFSLTVEVDKLRNSTGTVLFALYNREDAFPDEHYTKYLKKLTSKIVNGSASVTFENLPAGKYAVNILHDEDNNGKIKKGLILPKEGIGFSNFQSIGFSNRPSFEKASFNLSGDTKIKIKIIYM